MRFVWVGVLASLLAGQSPPKRRVAVFDFDNAAATGGMVSPFFTMTGPNVGKTVAELMVNRLVQGGTYSVIERAALDKLLQEQNLSNTDRFDPATAARIGRILGVDAIIIGSITEYTNDDKVTGGGSNRFGGMVGHGSMTTKHDIRARVQISARIVSPDTAEVVAVSQGQGEVFKKGVKVDVRDTSHTMNAMTGNTNNPVMTEALNQAVTQLATAVEQNAPRIPPRANKVEGRVADANESGRLILNVGSRAGVKPGDRVEVWRPGKPIRDPDTGKILRYDDMPLGEAEVSSVDEVSAVAMYKGTTPVAVGDRVTSRK